MNNFIFTPEWIAGFTQSDGSFSISFETRDKGILIRPRPVFNITQSNVEIKMFLELKKYLGVGNIQSQRDSISLVVTSLDDLLSVIIPLFDKSPLRGGKLESYLIFKEVCLRMKNKSHLTLEGLKTIENINSKMNQRRSES